MNQLLLATLLIVGVWPVQLQAQLRADRLVLKPDAKKHGLKGHVRKITQIQSPISNKSEDLLDGHSGQNFTEEYNQQGYLQKRISHDDFNKPRHATHYEYDGKGRLMALREEALAPDQFGSRTYGQIDYEYDDARNAFTVHDNRTIMGKALRRRTETIRDTLNRMLTTREYRQDTLLTQDQQYWWDKRGYVTKQISRVRNQPSTDFELKKEDLKSLMGTLSEQEERALDSLMQARDSLQRHEYKNRPEWTIDTTIYQNKYDRQGRLVEQKRYRSNKWMDIYKLTYSPEATQVVNQSFDPKGSLVSETTSRQHPVQRYILTDTTRHKVDGKWETSGYNHEKYTKPVYLYTHDAQGNWIEQKQVDADGKQIGVALVRRIEYYP